MQLLRAATKALAAEPDNHIYGTGILAFETVTSDQLLIGTDRVSIASQEADLRLIFSPETVSKTGTAVLLAAPRTQTDDALRSCRGRRRSTARNTAKACC